MNESIKDLLASGAVVPDRPGSKRLVPAVQSVVVPVDAHELRADLNKYVTQCVRSTPDEDMSLEESLIVRAHWALAAAPAPSSLAGGEDSAFRVATDLHAAYEALIYGLPKYLEAENLTDEENMVREAWIKLDVTAHRLAALSPEAPARDGAVVGPWRIEFYQPPIPTRNCDWSYCHEDYDGPESPSWMSGHASTRDECIAAIFHQYEERLP